MIETKIKGGFELQYQKRYVVLGIMFLLFSVALYVIPVNAQEDDDYYAAPDGVPEEWLNRTAGNPYNGTVSKDIPPEALARYESDVQVISSYLNNPIHPALEDSNNILYNDIDFYVYTDYLQDYKISIYVNSLDDPYVMEGETSFMAVENFMVPEGTKKIRKIVVLMGPHKYEWENVKIMHKAIDEDKVFTSPEDDISKKEMWFKTIQSFAGGLFAAVVFAFMFWRFWRHHLEHEIQEVL